jgi:hypothetical protein
VARADHWLSYSLRDPAQLEAKKRGGHAQSTSLPLSVIYDPAADAARVVIPFAGPLAEAISAVYNRRLGAAMSETDATLTLDPAAEVPGDPGRVYVVDGEVMIQEVGTPSAERARPVVRAQHGTASAAHVSGTTVVVVSNSLLNQIRVPLGTEDGHSYLLTWDALFTQSYLRSRTGLTTHKMFQIGSASGDARWLEIRPRYDQAPDQTTDIGPIDVRSYNAVASDPESNWSLTDGNTMGPGVTGNVPLAPSVGTLVIKPNRWTRFWVLVEQRVNDYDLMSMWVADEVSDPVLVYDRIPMSVRGPDFSLKDFWLEFNTSSVSVAEGRGELVAYVRNIAVLRDPQTSVPDLLLPPRTA